MLHKICSGDSLGGVTFGGSIHLLPPTSPHDDGGDDDGDEGGSSFSGIINSCFPPDDSESDSSFQ